MQQDWHFNIKGELLYGDQYLHLHHENFVNLIRISDYHNRLMPIILTRLQIDKNLFDYIITHAETCQIKLTITKYMLSSDGITTSPDETMIDDIFQVTVGSDVNYNKELDYVEQKMSEYPIQDKFRETYIGLVSKKCLDANKLVVNETVKDSLIQDVVLSYLLGGNLHPLVEPFVHNEKLEQTIVPPTDTLFSVIEYFNNLKVFYDTKFVFFIDEPNVTYLISKSGKGVEMKGEKYNSVILSMRNIVESKNLTIGMSNNGVTQAYQADISVLDSDYKIDTDTVKIINSIGSIINPSIDLSKTKDSAFKALKDMLKQQKNQFITNVLSNSKAVGDIALKMSDIVPKMSHAVQMIKDATSTLQTTVKQNIDDIISQLPVKQMSSIKDKSVLKSLMDSNFITCDLNLDLQANVKSNFSQVIDNTANQYYKMDFLDNMASSVTYVNLPDVSKGTDQAINGLADGVTQVVGEMADKITSKMGAFSNLTQTLGDMVAELGKWEQELDVLNQQSQTGQGQQGQDQSGGLYDALLKNIRSEQSNLTIMEGHTDEYGGIADAAYETGQTAQTNISGYAADFLKSIGGVGGSVDPTDIKSQFISKQPPITFGNMDLAQIMVMNPGGCFGPGQETQGNSGNALGSLADLDLGSLAQNALQGVVTFANLGELKDNLLKFDLSQIGKLGLGNIAFNLNLGCIPGLGEVAGTKLLKVRNDNPNQLKNIKSELELGKNTLSFNKFGMDPSVFTPNKRYLIKNYSAHENKDGVFILKQKIEVYSRDGASFVANTHLSFLKVVEQSSSSNVTDISSPNPNEANVSSL